jgi:hypothetical protein
VSLAKLRSPRKSFYSRKTFLLLEEKFGEMESSLQVSISNPPESCLIETPSKRVSAWICALFWMFNIDDLAFSEGLYDQVDKEINDLRSKIKKDNEKIK